MAEVSIISDGTNQYTLRDSVARQQIEQLANRTAYIGVTTTPLETGSTLRYIVIDGETVEVQRGNIVIYQTKQFLWMGSSWQQFGDTSTLGTLAYKDSAQATYTPQGTITNTDIDYTPQGSVTTEVATTSDTASELDTDGTLPSITYDAETETLEFDEGVLATFTEKTLVKTVDSASSEFTGTQATLQTTSLFQGTEETIVSE